MAIDEPPYARTRRNQRTEAINEARRAHADASRVAEQGGLKYAPGDQVLDTHTGQIGRVLSGNPVTGGYPESYAVEFPGPRVLLRTAAELERAPVAPSPATRVEP